MTPLGNGTRQRIAAFTCATALGLTGLAVAPMATAAVAPDGDEQRSLTAAAAGSAPDIDINAVVAQLENFQSIADANGGNRATGQPGYQVSLDHVQAELEAAGYQTEIRSFSTRQGTSYNLIADLPGSDEANTVMMGAHLDSVSAGPGINDNGTGSAAILETALAWAASNPESRNHVRFGFWGAEERLDPLRGEPLLSRGR